MKSKMKSKMKSIIKKESFHVIIMFLPRIIRHSIHYL